MAHAVIAGFFILVIAGGVGYGAASADSSDDLAREGAFGFDEATNAATLSACPDDGNHASANATSFDQSALAKTASRDIEGSLAMVEERKAAEQAHAKEEDAAALVRVENQKAMQGVETKKETPSKPAVAPPAADAPAESAKPAEEQAELFEYDLPKVDWTVGKEAFVSEWTARIDKFLEGSNLEGYGAVFAEAAWDNGVDPRWSPAISNTESSKGTRCFLPHNAWGWGERSWPDWSSAIRDHVAGLAEGYGYSLTFEAAQMYCPPNYVNWFNNTLSFMRSI